MVADQSALADLRREVDAIDDALHDLIMRRIALTASIAASKLPGSLALRPAREAKILRRLIRRHRGPFPKAVVARIWREIISANTGLQGPFAVAVAASGPEDPLVGVAREHFGCLTPIQTFETAQGVLRAVGELRASVGLLPLPRVEDAEPWWRLIARRAENVPRIVARLPFVQPQPPAVQGLVVSLAPNEATGEDCSYLILETRGEISRSTLKQQLAEVGLAVVEIQSWEDGQERRRLVEVEGFIDETAPAIGQLTEAGSEIVQVLPIGASARPLLAADLATAELATAELVEEKP